MHKHEPSMRSRRSAGAERPRSPVRNNARRTLSALIALVLTALILAGCSILIEFSEAPSAEEAKAFLSAHRDELACVAAYLKTLDKESAFIGDNGETVFYEFEDHAIEPQEVKESVRKLWRAGCSHISFNDENGNNTISFTIFTRTRGSIDCGIACTINGEGAPKTQFQISCEDIGDGWFYFYDDYEEYRVHPKQYEDLQPDYTPSK